MAMIYLNEISITGRLTKKPELKKFNNSQGKEVCVCTARIGFKDKRNSSKSYFLNVEVYGQKAIKVCDKYDKGTLVYIKGHLRKIKYINKEGHTRYKVDILCESIREAEGVYLNDAEITGYTTKKPEIKTVKTKVGEDLYISTVSLAFKDKRDYEKSYFIDIVIFGEDAKKFHEKIDKGTAVYLKGNLKNRSYTTSDGQIRNFLELIVESYQKIYLNKNKREENLNNYPKEKSLPEDEKQEKDVFGFEFIDDDDIPF